MGDPSLSELAKPLVPFSSAVFSVARTLWVNTKTLRAERNATSTPNRSQVDLMDAVFDETLRRLLGPADNEEWWNTLLDRAEHVYVAPDFIRKPALKEWLTSVEVRTDLKTIARNALSPGTQLDNEVSERLRIAYSGSTGEDQRLADEPIRVLVAILVAGFLSRLDRGDVPVAALIQTGLQGIRQELETFRRTVDTSGPAQATSTLISKNAVEALRLILKRRILEPERARQEIRLLEQRFSSSGDLQLADRGIQIEVVTWAARLHAIRGDALADAIRYRDSLRHLGPTVDSTVVDALILAAQGSSDAALQMIRDVQTDDGRSVLFVLLNRIYGQEQALEWFDQQPRRDEPNFLTEIGWYHLTVTLAAKGRWQEAIDSVRVAAAHFRECASLVFLEGMINAAMLLAEDVRLDILEAGPYMATLPTSEGPVSDLYRTAAFEALALATTMLRVWELPRKAEQARLSCLWLRLTDPRSDVSEGARHEVAQAMNDGSTAAALLPLVRRFQIEFDPKAVQRHLELRRKLGGLSDEETVAEFMLAMLTLSPRARAEYIEKEEGRLEAVLRQSYLTSERIVALADDGQIARAEALLSERRATFPQVEYERLQTLIHLHGGSDVRAEAEALYDKSRSLLDLGNLIRILRGHGDWVGATPLQEKRFGLERTLENAELLIDCLQRAPTPADAAVVTFLEENADLTRRSFRLSAAKAWALFHLGRWREADEINQELLRNRRSDLDLGLDTNLAIQTGDWERFSVIIEREWPRRDTHEPATLMRLACLAAEADRTSKRAMQLAALAATKGVDDPHILAGAVTLAYQLGREQETDPAWMARAVELSSDTGPVQRVDIRNVVEEIVPAHRHRTQIIEDSLVRGEIPLHFGASALNLPLSSILLALPRRNATQQDGRHRAVIPIVSGRRLPVRARADWVIGLDTSTVLILAQLDMLREAIDALRGVVLAPQTMVFLLNERRRVRFHQPSRVAKAGEVRSLLDRRRLRAGEGLSDPPDSLREEVGRDLGELLETARVNGGRVIRPLPVHNLRNLQMTEAQLGTYSGVLLSVATFVRLLHLGGKLDGATYRRARSYLSRRDRDDEVVRDPSVLDGPLYLDDLAVIYLQETSLLEEVSSLDLQLFVHPTMRLEQEGLIEAHREGELVADSLNAIRTTLRDSLASGKASFLPHSDSRDDELAGVPESFTLRAFLEDASPCDAVCIDDRFANGNPGLTDRRGRTVPLLCILDILRLLHEVGLLSAEQLRDKMHRLRQWSFGLVPVMPDELEGWLRLAPVDSDGTLTEGPELRAIRQSLMRIRSLDMLQQPMETPFLDRLRAVCALVTLNLWRDPELPIERATVLTDWLWRHVAPSPIDWARTSRERPGLLPLGEAFGVHLWTLLQILIVCRGERQQAFRDWLERSVLRPLLPQNLKLLDDGISTVKLRVEQWLDELTAAE